MGPSCAVTPPSLLRALERISAGKPACGSNRRWRFSRQDYYTQLGGLPVDKVLHAIDAPPGLIPLMRRGCRGRGHQARRKAQRELSLGNRARRHVELQRYSRHALLIRRFRSSESSLDAALVKLFSWPRTFVEALGPRPLEWLSLSISSTFSGAGTLEIAGSALSTAWSRLSCVAQPAVFTFTGCCCDYELGPQRLLASSPHVKHITGDILNLWPECTRTELMKCEGSLDAVHEFLAARVNSLSTIVSDCRPEHDDFDLAAGALTGAGPPCVDFSPMGRQARLLGPTIPALVTWCLWLCVTQPVFAIHENVVRFPWEKLADLTGNLFTLHPLELCPSKFGWPVRRPRRYTLLVHKSRGVLHRPVTDLLRVLGSVEDPQSLVSPQLFVWDGSASRVLPPCSQKYLAGYWTLLNGTRKLFAVDTSQDPLTRPRHAALTGALPVITCGSRHLYLPLARRCLSGLELLAAQGLPVARPLSTAMDAGTLSTSHLSRTALVRLAGNGMHATCIGAVLAWIGRYGQDVTAIAEPVPPSLTPLPDEKSAWLQLGQHWHAWIHSPENWSDIALCTSPPCTGSYSPFPLSRPSVQKMLSATDIPAANKGEIRAIVGFFLMAVLALNSAGTGGRRPVFGPTTAEHVRASAPVWRRVGVAVSCMHTAWMDCQVTAALPGQSLESFEKNECFSERPRLIASKVDLPSKAATCDPGPLVGPDLRQHLDNIGASFPAAPLGLQEARVPRHDAKEFTALVARMLSVGKVLLHRSDTRCSQLLHCGQARRR